MHEKQKKVLDPAEWIDAKTASRRFGVSIPRLHDLAHLENGPLEVEYENFGHIRTKLLFSVSSLRRWNATRTDRYRTEEREIDQPGRTEFAVALH